jgi:virginiamycin B lyase
MIRLSQLALTTLCASALASACADRAPSHDEPLGEIHAALTNAPPSVRCIILTAAGATFTAQQAFTLGGGPSATFRMTNLEFGWDQFSAMAFPGNCNNLSGVAATFVSDPVWAEVSARPNTIMLNMRPAGSTGDSTVSISFPTPRGQLTQFAIPSNRISGGGIISGGDGKVWFTSSGANTVGKVYPEGFVQEYPLPTASGQPSFLALGPDGNIWFTEGGTGLIGRVLQDGTIREFNVSGLPAASLGLLTITAHGDGNLWFVERTNNKIGRMTPTGTVTEFAIPTANSYAFGITSGPDGNVWFVEYNGNKLTRVLPNGGMTEFTIPTASARPVHLTTGSDGNIWFSEYGTSKIGKFDLTTFTFTEYPTPVAPFFITGGSDGKIWYTAFGGIYTITTSGVITQIPVALNRNGGPCPITVGPDGQAWVLESDFAKVSRVTMF